MERLERSLDDGVEAVWQDPRDLSTVKDGTRADWLLMHGAPHADVTRHPRRESLTRGMQDGFADTGPLESARRDRS